MEAWERGPEFVGEVGEYRSVRENVTASGVVCTCASVRRRGRWRCTVIYPRCEASYLCGALGFGLAREPTHPRRFSVPCSMISRPKRKTSLEVRGVNGRVPGAQAFRPTRTKPPVKTPKRQNHACEIVLCEKKENANDTTYVTGTKCCVVLCGTEMPKKENKLSIIDIKALYGDLLRGCP